MRHSTQVKKPAEQKIVVEKAVPNPFESDYAFERYLKRGKHTLEKSDQLVGCLGAQAADAAEETPNRQKLFLHQSVSRVKPSQHFLDKWVKKLFEAPMVHIPASGCQITLIQPNTKRPGRTFFNPTKPPGKHNYNDGMGYPSIVMLQAGVLPVNEHDEASHLCGHSRCMRLDHLRWETIGLNSMRNECHLYGAQCKCTPTCIPYSADHASFVRSELASAQATKKKLKQLTKYFFTKIGFPLPIALISSSIAHKSWRHISFVSTRLHRMLPRLSLVHRAEAKRGRGPGYSADQKRPVHCSHLALITRQWSSSMSGSVSCHWLMRSLK